MPALELADLYLPKLVLSRNKHNHNNSNQITAYRVQTSRTQVMQNCRGYWN